MPRFPRRIPTRGPRGRRTALGIAAASALAVLAPLLATSPSPALVTATSAAPSADPELATAFRIATLNVLGAGHTDGTPPKRKGFEKAKKRMTYVVQLMANHDLGLVGFQELQQKQFTRFMNLTNDSYGIYPGNELGPAAMHNSIVWRKSEWTLVRKETQAIPYGFKQENGKKVVSRIRMPVVLLERKATGQQVWVSNFHNAAKVVGPQAHRDEARQLEMALVKRLRAESPRTPVFVLGDLNEQKKVFCQFQRKAPLQAAGPGGVTAANQCVLPRPIGVDWIFGTEDVTFSRYTRLRNAKVKKATDHPLVYSDVHVAPPREQASAIRRVVVISVDGLRAQYVRNNLKQLPALSRMTHQGVATTRAHTVVESTKGLPNQLSMITGRQVKGAGGHGVTTEKLKKKTVHQTAGGYVPSMFDTVHDNGGGTSVFTTDRRFHTALASWAGSNGALDTQGLDNGRNKLNVRTLKAKPNKAVSAARQRLMNSSDALTYVHLSNLDTIGHAKGFGSKAWKKAAIATDKQVGRLLKLVANQSKLRGNTLVVLTSAHGGAKKKHNAKASPKNHTVPFLLWGPAAGTPAGADLFDLNPHLEQSNAQLANSTPTVRNASVANVVLTALRRPSVPGSAFGWSQHVTWRSGS